MENMGYPCLCISYSKNPKLQMKKKYNVHIGLESLTWYIAT